MVAASRLKLERLYAYCYNETLYDYEIFTLLSSLWTIRYCREPERRRLR